jgi:PEGA domain
MKRLLSFVVVAVLLVSFSGCATIFRGPNQQVSLNASMAGAEVFIDGQKVGVTPLKLSLKTDKQYTVTFKKAGFKDTTYRLTNRVGTLWVVLDVLSGLIPLIVDISTGAWYEFETTDVNVTLEPGTLNSVDPAPRDYSQLLLSR